MANKLLLGLAMLIVIVGGIWLWKGKGIPAGNQMAGKTPAVKAMEVKEESDRYMINAKYPEFSGGAYVSGVAGVNVDMKAQIDKSIAEFKTAAVESTEVDTTIKSSLDINYKVIFINENVVSIKWSDDAYIESAAHPLGVYFGFNYNFKDNKEIKIADLFKPGSDFNSILSIEARKSLKSQLGDGYFADMAEPGTDPKMPENFETFVLEKDNLVLIFNVYQVAAYAAGPQEVKIPYSQMAEFINASGVVRLLFD